MATTLLGKKLGCSKFRPCKECSPMVKAGEGRKEEHESGCTRKQFYKRRGKASRAEKGSLKKPASQLAGFRCRICKGIILKDLTHKSVYGCVRGSDAPRKVRRVVNSRLAPLHVRLPFFSNGINYVDQPDGLSFRTLTRVERQKRRRRSLKRKRNQDERWVRTLTPLPYGVFMRFLSGTFSLEDLRIHGIKRDRQRFRIKYLVATPNVVDRLYWETVNRMGGLDLGLMFNPHS